MPITFLENWLKCFFRDDYLRNEKALSRLLPAVLGAFSSKCALCGWDAICRSEIRKALKSTEGVMLPMPELEGWVNVVENKVRSCAAEHSGFQICRLLRMLKVKVEIRSGEGSFQGGMQTLIEMTNPLLSGYKSNSSSWLEF